MINHNKYNKLKTLIQETMEDISIEKRSSINNVMTKYDFHEYKDQFLKFKKDTESSIAHSLTNFLNSSLDLGLTVHDCSQILYNLKTRVSFGLFGDLAIEFDKESFVDELQTVLQDRTKNKKSFINTGI